MITSESKSSIKSTVLDGISAAISLFPFLLAFGVCSPFGAGFGVISAITIAICGFLFEIRFAEYVLVLVIQCAAAQYGTSVAIASFAVTVIALIPLLRLKAETAQKLTRTPVVAGLMIGTAFSLTALQTTNYFGIDAVGADVLEMLTSYRSLGFHANWRGVFYGTVVMVIMITFPRGFKNFSKKISPAFIGLGVTAVLGVLLNPASRPSAINEVGIVFTEKPLFSLSQLHLSDIPAIIVTGCAVAVIIWIDRVTRTIGAKEPKRLRIVSVPSKIIGTAILFAIAFSGIIERLPVHSLAVVIIVGAWQSVAWGKIGKSVKGGVSGGILMIISAALPVFIYPAAAVLTLTLLCAALAIHDKRKGSAVLN